jgi:hypothetical protein
MLRLGIAASQRPLAAEVFSGSNLANPAMLNPRQFDRGKLPKSLHMRELQGSAKNGPGHLQQYA